MCIDICVQMESRSKGVPLWAFLPALNSALGGKTLEISHEAILDHEPFHALDTPFTVEAAQRYRDLVLPWQPGRNSLD